MTQTTKRIALGMLAVVALFAAGWAIYASTQPRFKPGQVYQFRYTFKSDLAIKGTAVPLSGRTFVFADGSTFSVPLAGPRGEPLAVVDRNMNANSLKIVPRESPKLQAGSVFQEKYKYQEVRYYFPDAEPQRVIPRLAPTNK